MLGVAFLVFMFLACLALRVQVASGVLMWYKPKNRDSAFGTRHSASERELPSAESRVPSTV